MKKICTLVVLTIIFGSAIGQVNYLNFCEFTPKTVAPNYLDSTLGIYLNAQSLLVEDSILEENEFEHILVNTLMFEALFHYGFSIEDSIGFSHFVFDEVSQIGLTEKQLYNMSPQGLALLSGVIVANNMRYDSTCIKKHKKLELSLDEVLEGGCGVCFEISMLNTAVFNELKKYSQYKDVLFMKTVFVPEMVHAFNEIIVLAHYRMYITYVDPTAFVSIKDAAPALFAVMTQNPLDSIDLSNGTKADLMSLYQLDVLNDEISKPLFDFYLEKLRLFIGRGKIR